LRASSETPSIGPDVAAFEAWRGRSILHVVANLGFGGTEVFCRDLARALSDTFEVRNVVFASAADRNIEPDYHQVMSIPPAIGPDPAADRMGYMLALRRFCAQQKPDGAIFHFFGVDHLTGALALRSLGIRRVHAVAGNPAPPPCARDARHWRTILRLSRIAGVPIISASSYIEASLARLAPLPRGSRVIHYGCNTDAVAARARQIRSARQDRGVVRIGMVARLDPIKDHSTLLTALALARSTCPERHITLDIIGDGPLRPQLEAQVHRLGLEDAVEFLGSRPDVPELLGRLDIFVLATSAQEGFGIVLIEALAAGVPVIASDVPACREVLARGALGTLVPAGDPGAMAEAILNLARQLPRPLRAVPIREVRERYDISSAAARHLEALSSMAALD